ncbi:DMT family transporter [Martelella endophytica]|uniref:Transporter n=1 Tax=Martelella endophytica TaxID=1486262 RepID=A0A0D5LTY7_MAREN|nr:DMT family transporter [Martelella endophytica]AJY47684.1 transporter [Martelella endophytica]
MHAEGATAATADHTIRGVVLSFISFAAFSFSDACVKMLEGGLPAYEAAFFGALFAFAALPFIMKRGDRLSDIVRTGNRPLWLLRFIAYPVGVIGSVTAFTHLSMAEAFVLIFLQPAYVTVMSMVFLKEQVGYRRWLAVLVGFIGVLIVLRPGFRELSIGHLGAIFAGLGGAVSVITYRMSGSDEKKISLFGAGVLGAVIVCGALTLTDFQMPDARQWLALAGYGLVAAIANVILMQAALYAPANLVGPTQYSQMLWAVFFGYVFFGDRIDGPMIAGIILIVGAGMLTLMRERTRGTPLPPPILAGNTQAPIAMEEEEMQL